MLRRSLKTTLIGSAIHSAFRCGALGLIALGAISLSSLPAASHSAAKCKFEKFDACLRNGGSHAVCVNYTELQCAGHSHGSGTGSSKHAVGGNLHNPNSGPSRWHRRQQFSAPKPPQTQRMYLKRSRH